MLNTRKMEKVCTGWQTGLYPNLVEGDVVEGCHPYWIKEFKMVLFEIGLEDLEFLVKRKGTIDSGEDVREIGYPKVVKVTKIKDFVNPELMVDDENWEWVYWGRIKYGEDTREIAIEQTTIDNTNNYIWLENKQKPLYRLRSQYNFSNIEKLYYRSRNLVKYKLYRAENWYNKISKNVFMGVGQYLMLWIVTTGIYKFY